MSLVRALCPRHLDLGQLLILVDETRDDQLKRRDMAVRRPRCSQFVLPEIDGIELGFVVAGRLLAGLGQLGAQSFFGEVGTR